MSFRISNADNFPLYPFRVMPICITQTLENSYMRRDNVFF